MSLLRSIGLHVVLTVVAAAAALSSISTDDEATEAEASNVLVWDGKVDELTSIRFESEKSKTLLIPKRDEVGLYFTADVDREEEVPARHSPHAPPDEKPDAKGKRVKSKFIAVKEATTLAEQVAPLMALRAIGRVDAKREEEFGFDKPEGKLFVKFGGTEHQLVVGGLTPGGGDRYVRLIPSNETYAIRGEIVRGMSHANSRLLERDLHGFGYDEVTRVRISKGDKSRELVPVEGKADGWADVKTARTQDETAGNWLTKVNRLRISEYLPTPPKLEPKNLDFRVDYFIDKKNVGYLEVSSRPAKGDSLQFLVKTEHTRWYAEVLESTAEQLKQDVESVLQGSAK